jgi:hypothetical protein
MLAATWYLTRGTRRWQFESGCEWVDLGQGLRSFPWTAMAPSVISSILLSNLFTHRPRQTIRGKRFAVFLNERCTGKDTSFRKVQA